MPRTPRRPRTAHPASVALPPASDAAARARGLFDQGLIAHHAGALEQAVHFYEEAIRVEPGLACAHDHLGAATRMLGRADLAVPHFERAIALDPRSYRAHNNLGDTLAELGRLAEATQCLERAIVIDPRSPAAYNTLAAMFWRQDALEEAVICCDLALAVDPDHAGAHNTAGVVRRTLGDLDAARAHFEHALTSDPRHADARWNLGCLQLLAGEFAAGWVNFEARWSTESLRRARRTFPRPEWDGAPLGGRTILLHAEQGAGDAIQFIRYVPLVERAGGRVVLECDTSLTRLVRRCMPSCDVVTASAPLPPFDVHAPLLSLPRILGTTVETIPAATPYLRAREERTRESAAFADAGDSLRIGIAWAGSPRHRDDRNRSIPLAAFAGILAVPGARFYSLQAGVRRSELRDLPAGAVGHVVDLGAAFGDFDDTAAAIAELDLVISVDTSVAHLAGALGAPVWVLLPFAPDWRWLAGRSDSPWYPTATLFRQPALRDWSGALGQVERALATANGRGLTRRREG